MLSIGEHIEASIKALVVAADDASRRRKPPTNAYRKKKSKPKLPTVDEFVAKLEKASTIPSVWSRLNYELYVMNFFPISFASMPYIAEKIGYHIRTVIRANALLEEWGILRITRSMERPGKNNSNIYDLHCKKLLKNPEVRYRLGRLYPALRGFALAALFLVPLPTLANPYYSKNVTPINKNMYKYLTIERNVKINTPTGTYIGPPTTERLSNRNTDSIKEESRVIIKRNGVSPLTESKQSFIDYLNPTDRFRIEIEKYTLDAIRHAATQLRQLMLNGVKFDSHALKFFKLAEVYSRDHKLPVNRPYVSLLCHTYNPSGPWIDKPIDITALKAEETHKKSLQAHEYERKKQYRQQQNNNAYQHPVNPIQAPGESSTAKRKREKAQHDALIATLSEGDAMDKTEEMARAILKAVNGKGEITNPFMAIIANSIKKG